MKRVHLCMIIANQLLLFLSGFSNMAIAQCPINTSLYLRTQQVVDEFGRDYPNCTEVKNLHIYSDPRDSKAITNLNGLSSIKRIQNDLIIRESHRLPNLNGLDSLKEVVGDVKIYENDSLINLEGLNNLFKIEGDIRINDNPNLEDISNLESLNRISGSFLIERNNFIELELPNSLRILVGDLTIKSNHQLKNISGLNSLGYHSGKLRINYNDSLEHFNQLGINMPWKPIDEVSVWGNFSLNSIDGCSNFLVQDPDFVAVGYSLELNNLNGLSHIMSCGELYIEGNDELLSLAEINQIQWVNTIGIINLPLLSDLSGLENLTTTNDYFVIAELPALQSLKSMESLLYIGNTLIIADCDALQNLDGLNDSLWIEESVRITSNNQLNSCRSYPLC